MEVGQEIRARREAKGWSQAKLAGVAGMGVSGVSQIETGTRNPSAVTLQKLADALDVDVAEFFPKAIASSPSESERRRLSSLDSGEASEPRHRTVHELSGKIQEMKQIERRRRRDIDQWGSDELGYTRVWEWQVFDQYLRDEFGGFVDSVNHGPVVESSKMQLLCQEFGDQLSTLEKLSARARVISDAVEAEVYVGAEKAAHGLQKDLQENHGVDQQVEK